MRLKYWRMARPPRDESPDAILHVYSRGNYRRAILADRWAAFLTIYNQLGL
jgi:hypothetical protein